VAKDTASWQDLVNTDTKLPCPKQAGNYANYTHYCFNVILSMMNMGLCSNDLDALVISVRTDKKRSYVSLL
jgi:hypothetical protein